MSKFQDIIRTALNHWLPGERVFENHRPAWLQGLELDFYYPALRLAIEVNGKQHYKRIPSMQTGPEHDAQRQRDARKRRLVFVEGIHLIILRQKKGWVVCGLQGKLRDALPERKFGTLPLWIRSEWKSHSKKMSALWHEAQKDRWEVGYRRAAIRPN